jgi:monoamine oxidase
MVPALPSDQQQQMSKTATWAGDWAKVVATFKTPFWRKDGFSGVAATPGEAVSTWWESGGGDETGEASASLAGVGFGIDTVALGQIGKNDDNTSAVELTSKVEKTLVSLYGSVASDQLLSVHHAAWITDPLTYSPPNGGNIGDPEAMGDPRQLYGHPLLRKPLPWGVHFAGTETEAESGHVEGAIKAGERAAEEVAGALGK